MYSDYEDIINLERPISQKRPKMSIYDRAAQFSPFAALTGFKESVNETGRLTESEIFLDENQYEMLNQKILVLQKNGFEDISIKIVYFLPDKFKSGGSYEETEGVIKKIDQFDKTIVMLSGEVIPIDNIVDINSDIFNNIDDKFTI